jgi:hypothetical protein
MAVLAYLPLELRGHPDPVSHPYFSCKLDIPVAATWMFLEYCVGKLKKPENTLICHVL